jgi:hypothetical protein
VPLTPVTLTPVTLTPVTLTPVTLTPVTLTNVTTFPSGSRRWPVLRHVRSQSTTSYRSVVTVAPVVAEVAACLAARACSLAAIAS